MKILVVSQDYSAYDKKFGDIRKNELEIRRLYASFFESKGSSFQKNFAVDYFFDTPKDFKDLQVRVVSGDYDIIHFSFHGYNGKVFFSENKEYYYNEFAKIFNVGNNVTAVILNICDSAELAETISNNVDWVLGWSREPKAEETQKVTELFYVSLFGGNSIPDSFKRMEDQHDINLKIYKPAKPTEQKRSGKPELQKALKILTGLIIIVITIISFKVFRKEDNPVKENISITFPLQNSDVEPNINLKITAKLRPESRPWVFISPPNSHVWWPQFEAESEDQVHWHLNVNVGNDQDSGQFRIIAMAIHDSLTVDMRAWLNSQGRDNSSDPLNGEQLNAFFWYTSDTIIVNRIPY